MDCTLMHKNIPVVDIEILYDTGRSIPASRNGIKEALKKISVLNTAMLIDKCYGLSLSDQYWICLKGSGLG